VTERVFWVLVASILMFLFGAGHVWAAWVGLGGYLVVFTSLWRTRVRR
jgi:hypothetical protein